MSKLVSDLIADFQSLDELESDFGLFVLLLNISDAGEITSDETSEAILPVSRIEIHDETQACLLHVTADGQALSIDETTQTFSKINPDYQLGYTQLEKTKDESVMMDYPIIGFGENIDQRRYFVVCQAPIY